MKISLRKITEKNCEECLKLSLFPDQRKFMGSNENSLAQAYAYRELEPRAIYNDETMVGFIMYAKDPERGNYYINRFMIDKNYQRKGFGREALKLLLAHLKETGVEAVDILHRPDNHDAVKLYRELGFEATEDTYEDDQISRVKLI
ncbi:MAG TPA: GNAT family N-acetyltransferase [Ignavibacteria bacterium]|nr:GNAT family N-acetyltransferase [Ignavibacteria bacterium]